MLPPLPAGWNDVLRDQTEQSYFRELNAFLEQEAAAGHAVLPPQQEIFHALALTPFERVRVILLGQDPYPTPGDAHGLCFSVRRGHPIPRSLRNVYKELQSDLGLAPPAHGNLEAWAERGLLLLNTVLTVRAGEANSHRKRGWERFTDALLRQLSARPGRLVFLLWGNAAQTKRVWIDESRHAVVACAHPSPLSARLFLGCRCFSAVNRHLADAGLPPFNWQLPP